MLNIGIRFSFHINIKRYPYIILAKLEIEHLLSNNAAK